MKIGFINVEVSTVVYALLDGALAFFLLSKAPGWVAEVAEGWEVRQTRALLTKHAEAPTEELLAAYQVLLKRYPQDGRLLLVLANLYARQRDWPKAEAAYAKVLSSPGAKDEHKAWAEVGRGVAGFAREFEGKAGPEGNRPDIGRSAEAHFNRAREFDSHCGEAWVNLALLNLWRTGAAGDSETLQRLENAFASPRPLTRNALDAGLYQRGVVYARTKKLKESRETFAQLALLRPKEQDLDKMAGMAQLSGVGARGVDPEARRDALTPVLDSPALLQFGKQEYLAWMAIATGIHLLRVEGALAQDELYFKGKWWPTAERYFEAALKTGPGLQDPWAYRQVLGFYEHSFQYWAQRQAELESLRRPDGRLDQQLEAQYQSAVSGQRQILQKMLELVHQALRLVDQSEADFQRQLLVAEAELQLRQWRWTAGPGAIRLLEDGVKKLRELHSRADFRKDVGLLKRLAWLQMELSRFYQLPQPEPDLKEAQKAYKDAVATLHQAEALAPGDPQLRALVPLLGQKTRFTGYAPTRGYWPGRVPLFLLNVVVPPGPFGLSQESAELRWDGQRLKNYSILGTQILFVPGAQELEGADHRLEVSVNDGVNPPVRGPQVRITRDVHPPSITLLPEATPDKRVVVKPQGQRWEVTVADEPGGSGVDLGSISVEIAAMRGTRQPLFDQLILIRAGVYQVALPELNIEKGAAITTATFPFACPQELLKGTKYKLLITVGDRAGKVTKKEYQPYISSDI